MGTALRDEIAKLEDDLVALLLSLVRKRTQLIKAVLLGADIYTAGGISNKTILTGSTFSDLKKLGSERSALRGRGDHKIFGDHSPGNWNDSISVVAPSKSVFRVQIFGDPIDFIPIIGKVVDGTKAFLSIDDDGDFIRFVGENADESRKFTDDLEAGSTIFTYTLANPLVDAPELEDVFRVNRQDGAPINYWGKVVLQGLERHETNPLRWWTDADDVFFFDFATFAGFLGGLSPTTNTPLVNGIVKKSIQTAARRNVYFPYTDPQHPEEPEVYTGIDVYKGRQQHQDHFWNFDNPSHSNVTGDGSTEKPFKATPLDLSPMVTDIQAALDKFAAGHNPSLFSPFGGGWSTSGTIPEPLYSEHPSRIARIILHTDNVSHLGLQQGILSEPSHHDLIVDFATLHDILVDYREASDTETFWTDDITTQTRTFSPDWESGGLTAANIVAALDDARLSLNARLAQITGYIGTVESGGRAQDVYNAVNLAISRSDGWMREMLQGYTSYDQTLVILGDFLERHNKLQSLSPIERTLTDGGIEFSDAVITFINTSLTLTPRLQDAIEVADASDTVFTNRNVRLIDTIELVDRGQPISVSTTFVASDSAITVTDLIQVIFLPKLRTFEDSIGVNSIGLADDDFFLLQYHEEIFTLDLFVMRINRTVLYGGNGIPGTAAHEQIPIGDIFSKVITLSTGTTFTDTVEMTDQYNRFLPHVQFDSSDPTELQDSFSVEIS